MFVDSHCHLHSIDLSLEHNNDFDALVAEMTAAKVEHCLCVCVALDEYDALQAISKQYPMIDISVGVHPNVELDTANEPTLLQLCELSNAKGCVAIGETGLDYFRSSGELEWQRRRFRTHIQAANETKKPLIIHTRNAYEDTLTIMQQEQAERCGGVMHCFAEDWAAAREALAMNFYISLSGIVTFKNAKQVHEVANLVPLDRLLIETDSPYLAPMPYRGKRNRPAWVTYVAKRIAELRGVSVEEIAGATRDNYFRLFHR